MDGSGKRKRSDDGSEGRLFKKFEALESRLIELWAHESNREGGSNTLEPLDAGLTEIVSFVDEQIDGNGNLDEEEELFNEDDFDDDGDNFNDQGSLIEELPREIPPIEEITLSDEELTNTWEDSGKLDNDTGKNQDVILLEEQEEKEDEFILNSESNGIPMHPDIKEIWTVWTRSGIPMKDKEELLNKYAPPNFLKTPVINPEIDITLHKRPIEKDEYIRSSQEILSSALTALGSTMSALISDNEKSDKLKVMNNLNDTAKLLTELFHFDTEKRRSNIISWKPQPVQALLVGTKPDEFLFGRNLDEKIQQAQKSGRMGTLKPYVFKKNNHRPYKFFPSPYHWFGREEEEEQHNFVLNPMKQEPQEANSVCKKEKLEEFLFVKLE